MKHPIFPFLLASATLSLLWQPAAHGQDFATHAAGSNLSPNPLYSDPTAATGQPTTLFTDPYSNNDTFHRSLVASADGPAPDNSNTLVNLGSSGNGVLTVSFNTNIVHDASHWYGMDFLVFSNQAFNGDYDDDGFVGPNQDMSAYHLGDGSTYSQLPTVSISPDGVTWYTYPSSSGTMTDANGNVINDGYGGTSYYYPENAYAWNRTTHDWGGTLDFTKPVDPSLTAADFAGKTVADAIDLYDGSAGGVGFSLAGTPFTSIQYIRFTGTGNIDAVSRVSQNPAAAPEPSTLCVFAVGLVGLIAMRRRKTA